MSAMVCDDIFVTSSGEMKLQKPVRTIRKSGRRDFLLLYVCEGKCVLSSDGGSLTAEKGSVVFYRPSEPQDYYFPAEPVNHNIWVHFSGDKCDELLAALNIGNERILKPSHTARIEHIFSAICDSFLNKNTESSVICTGLLTALLGMLAEYTKEESSHAFGEYRRIIGDEIMRFKTTPYQKMTIAKSAENCGMSVTHFSRVFKSVTGEPPLKYITRVKIERAKEMLIFTDESIASIAASVGYTDQNYFARIFKRFTGFPPSKIR